MAVGTRITGGRARRWPARAAIALALVLVLGVLAGGWYFADQLTLPPTVRPFEPDNEVVAVEDDVVTLRDEGFLSLGGRWGLQLPQGRHVVLAEQLATDGDTTTWRYEDLRGGPAPVAGEPVRVDEFVWSGDPAAVGLAFDEVVVDAPVGDLPAWWVPADGEPVGTVVFVHGRGATRAESLRFLPAMVGAGWNVLVQSYRGDEGAPDWPDGRVRFGTQEWADVQAGVGEAVLRSPGQPIVLFGVSMGGALATQYLDRGSADGGADPAVVEGLVLDSPVLSLDALLDLQAGLNGVPPWAEPLLLPVVKLWAGLLHDLDADALEQIEADATFDLPTLLIHGDDDTFVPPAPTWELASLLDDTTLLRTPTAGHVRTWNVAPAAYDAALVAFLEEVAS